MLRVRTRVARPLRARQDGDFYNLLADSTALVFPKTRAESLRAAKGLRTGRGPQLPARARRRRLARDRAFTGLVKDWGEAREIAGEVVCDGRRLLGERRVALKEQRQKLPLLFGLQQRRIIFRELARVRGAPQQERGRCRWDG